MQGDVHAARTRRVSNDGALESRFFGSKRARELAYRSYLYHVVPRDNVVACAEAIR